MFSYLPTTAKPGGPNVSSVYFSPNVGTELTDHPYGLVGTGATMPRKFELLDRAAGCERHTPREVTARITGLELVRDMWVNL